MASVSFHRPGQTRRSLTWPSPYAGGLKEPGKSKRAWDANFLQQFQKAANGDAMQFELTSGRTASGTIRITQFKDGNWPTCRAS